MQWKSVERTAGISVLLLSADSAAHSTAVGGKTV